MSEVFKLGNPGFFSWHVQNAHRGSSTRLPESQTHKSSSEPEVCNVPALRKGLIRIAFKAVPNVYCTTMQNGEGFCNLSSFAFLVSRILEFRDAIMPLTFSRLHFCLRV